MIILIDSNFLCYQAFYTLGSLSYDDMKTGIIFGFLGRVLSIYERFECSDFIFCWDSRKSHRKREFPAYKVKRKEKTKEEKEALQIAYVQFNLLKKEILPQIGFKNIVSQSGLESDDLIAKICIDEIEPIIFISSDSDLYQCLNVNAHMFIPTKDKIMTDVTFKEEYEIEPSSWSEVKAIAGCTSDSVPGIKGVGEKTAIKYLRNELKEGAKLTSILSDEGQEIIERNRSLVRLPHRKTRRVNCGRDNDFSFKNFKSVCETFGMFSLLEKSTIRKWRELLQDKPLDLRPKRKRRKIARRR